MSSMAQLDSPGDGLLGGLGFVQIGEVKTMIVGERDPCLLLGQLVIVLLASR